MEDLRSRFSASLAYLPPQERSAVLRALQFAERWHEGQKRESGDPFIIHPLSAALYLVELDAGKDMLVAALLHDVVEDERADREQIRKEFGDDVVRLVEGLTKLSKIRQEGNPSFRQVASLRKLLLLASEDIRVILIKLADRLHNVETLSVLRPEKQQRIAQETLDIYIPFARIVGLRSWSRKLEEHCFPIALPEESAVWHAAIQQKRAELEQERLAFVESANNFTPKRVHPTLVHMTDFEIYQRLFHDLSRLRDTSRWDYVQLVISNSSTVADCYQILGAVHTRHPVRSLSFRDFINAPQPNGYQALHTTIFLSRDHEVRLRIQTQEMFDFATKRKVGNWISAGHSDVTTALSSLHKPTFDQDRYVTDLKQVVLDRMNVFTTAGEVISLPRGATGVDFAFFINPNTLSSLAGVRVNGEERETTTQLRDGDTVELMLLETGGRPERSALWLNKVKSIEARAMLQQSLEEQPPLEKRSQGRVMLEYEAQKWRLPLWWLFHWAKTQVRLTQALGEESFDTLLEKVGSGQLAVGKVIDAYRALLNKPAFLQRLLMMLRLLPRSRVLNREASVIDIDVYSVDQPGMIYNLSKSIADRKINISKFAVYAVPPKDALYQIRLEVKDFHEFSELYDALLQVSGVKKIRRRK
ncbi:MAG: HD domain-containing protein [Candidatus Peribacteraceae bacterium]|jgi:GTP pyrophosphokinase